MTRARLACIALGAPLAACNLGIGSDPTSGPRSACAPGHARVSPTGACVTPLAAIAIDGSISDWSALSPIALAATCAAPPCDSLLPSALWLASSPEDNDLSVRVSFGTAPPSAATDLRVAVELSPSAARPASGGADRLVANAAMLAYEKSGYTVTPQASPYRWAWTADGFEAEIDGGWLTYQGAARVAISVERAVTGVWMPVATTTPVDACFGFGSGSGALPASACEVMPR